MAEHLYTTPALILGGSDVGEANRLLDLLTESHGRIRAIARGVRFERSKLRYHLEPLRFSTVSLVRGRELWRLVGAVGGEHYRSLTPSVQAIMRNSVRLLRRLLQGEEAAPALYRTVADGFTFLAREPLSEEALKNAECILILRILHQLGYVGREEPVSSYLNEAPLTSALIASVAPIRRTAIARINESLGASSL